MKPKRMSELTVPVCSTRKLLLALLTAASLSLGCSSDSEIPAANSDADLMDELLGEPSGYDSGTSEAPEVVSSEAASNRRNVQTVSDSSSQSVRTATAHGERLELRLQPGDRFPLIKTIEQHLIQRSEQFPATAHTRLELTLAITVDQVRSDAILLSVRYSRINYSHDINGSRLEYDSAIHQSGYPRDAEPYAGMVNNGFSFWVGRDNKIRELVGYQEFLQRCVQNVPVERRQTMLAEISNRFGDDGVANFVDDSIGLLPYDASVDANSATRVAVGDVWTRETRLMQPATIYLTSTYRLVTLDAETAEIEISGRIASGETVPTADSSMLKISGGHSMGKCTVDRRTGLPLDVTVTRFVNMLITLPGGQTVPQDKQIFTRIRAFPEKRGPVVQNIPPQPGNSVLQASGTQMPGRIQQAAGFAAPTNNAMNQTSGAYQQSSNTSQSSGPEYVPYAPSPSSTGQGTAFNGSNSGSSSSNARQGFPNDHFSGGTSQSNSPSPNSGPIGTRAIYPDHLQ